MKTHVLIVSRYFPATHPRNGEPTQFVEKIKSGEKLHTIRSNYEWWEKRVVEVQAGKAELSLRYWSGKPYRSKQVEFLRLDKDSGIGIQKVVPIIKNSYSPEIDGRRIYNSFGIAKNDGLSVQEFRDWFNNYDLTKPMAIIHFTDFRYSKWM